MNGCFATCKSRSECHGHGSFSPRHSVTPSKPAHPTSFPWHRPTASNHLVGFLTSPHMNTPGMGQLASCLNLASTWPTPPCLRSPACSVPCSISCPKAERCSPPGSPSVAQNCYNSDHAPVLWH
uniref:Uncharacterized protein n=1 Tax=Mustela putorius furo TaxID=9669 RepID=M3YMN8_MUSPF